MTTGDETVGAVPATRATAQELDGWREARRLAALLPLTVTPDGFGQLDARCRLLPDTDGNVLINARLTYCAALGTLLGWSDHGFADAAAHGVAALSTRFTDQVHGGFRSVLGQGEPGKRAYQHSFVLLTASTCAAAGITGADRLLEAATTIMTQRFFSAADQALIESWDDAFTTREPYWGANANMHGVEATLAAYVATGDTTWRDRATAIADTFINRHARAEGWMLPEHYSLTWQVLRDYNADRVDDVFRPFGVTIGHMFEWSRLLLELASAYAAEERPAWLIEAAAGLYDNAARLGWSVDGAPGFVYTVDWEGIPVVHQRLHWVATEAIGAAASWRAVTGEARYAEQVRTWLAYADASFIDRVAGSWHHELDRTNRPAGTIAPGKEDLYHALQMALILELPVAPSLVARIRQTP